VLPLIAGQVLGYPALGLMVGLGGLYVSITDIEGSTGASLLIAALINGIAVLCGTWIANNVWLSIAAMFVWAFLGGMASAYGEVVSQIGFISVLAFAVSLGLPGSIEAGIERMVAFIAGGLWGAILTLLLWRLDQKTSELSDASHADQGLRLKHGVGTEWAKKFASNLSFRSIIFRHALRLAVASTIAVALFKFLRLERGYWLTITVLVIVKPTFVDTRKRTMERVLGSVAGGALAALIAAGVHNVVILDVLLVVFSVLAYSNVRYHYGLFVFFLTPFVVLMVETVQPTDWHIVLTRIFDTLIGAAIALIVTYLLRPKSAFRW
jgi:Fusaric acid resistance protein-like